MNLVSYFKFEFKLTFDLSINKKEYYFALIEMAKISDSLFSIPKVVNQLIINDDIEYNLFNVINSKMENVYLNYDELKSFYPTVFTNISKAISSV
jgi:hypothetical protein